MIKSATASAVVLTAQDAGPKLFRRFQNQDMKTKTETKLVREYDLVANVPVERIDTGFGLSPYLSLEGAQKLDSVKEASRRGDVRSAARPGRVFRLTPAT